MKKKAHGFFAEFKAFISKGSVLDLAVGVIIGGAFTAIVTALTSHILQPLINFLIAKIAGGDALKSAVWILSGSADDLENAIYIDFGAFISAIINFFLVALILFIIVKSINKARESTERIKAAEREKYYAKHPEERPVEKAPEAPKPTEAELLTEIRDLLKENKK